MKYDYYSPTRAYAMQNILDAIVFGAIWPYPTVVIIVMVNSMELAKLIQFFINRFRKMQLVKVYIKVLRFYRFSKTIAFVNIEKDFSRMMKMIS